MRQYLNTYDAREKIFNKYHWPSCMTGLYCVDSKTTRNLMKDSVWIYYLALSAINSIVNAFDRPTWSPECSPNDTLLPDPGDCGKFFKCLNGTAYPISCPVGLHWSQSLSKCDNPDVVNCQPMQARTFESEYNPLCPVDENPWDPTVLPNEFDCGRFYQCLGGYALVMACPSGQHWSKELKRCESPLVANCQRKESRTLIGNGGINPDCPLWDDPSNPSLLPYPTDCGKFYKCAYGRSYILDCPYALHWDVKSNRCESPFVARCSSGEGSITQSPSTQPTTRPTTPPTPTPPSTAKPPTAAPDPNLPTAMPECSDHTSLKKFSIPGECKVFMQCYNGFAFRIRCREGREWSLIENDCIDAALAGCSTTSGSDGGSQTTTSTTKATTTPITRAPTQAPTSCTPGVEYLSHPSDCTKFIQCDNGLPVEMECAPGTYWSKTTKNCQWTPNDCR